MDTRLLTNSSMLWVPVQTGAWGGTRLLWPLTSAHSGSVPQKLDGGHPPRTLVWPAEYVILVIWLVLGAVIYAIAPKEEDEQALRALLGDQYGKLGAEPGETETATSDRAP